METDLVFELTNRSRRANGAPGLKRSLRLNRSAKRKAKRLARSEVLAHGRWAQLIDRITHRGFGAIGENIADGQTSAAQVVEAWMNSPEHRENILNPEFTHMGVGLASSEDGTEYWCQHFGGR